MKTNEIKLGDKKIIEIITDEIIIRNPQDALDIMANIPSDHIILHQHNFEKDFFDLQNGKLGEILQKFTNYFVKLAIIGDFNTFESKSLKAFIFESNQRRNFLFIDSIDEVKKIWSNTVLSG